MPEHDANQFINDMLNAHPDGYSEPPEPTCGHCGLPPRAHSGQGHPFLSVSGHSEPPEPRRSAHDRILDLRAAFSDNDLLWRKLGELADLTAPVSGYSEPPEPRAERVFVANETQVMFPCGWGRLREDGGRECPILNVANPLHAHFIADTINAALSG